MSQDCMKGSETSKTRKNKENVITLANDQLDAQIFNTFIAILYIFRAISCSSSWGCSVVVLFYVLFVCECVLPPGDNPTADNKYIDINIKLC
jgi:hypothetical protein